MRIVGGRYRGRTISGPEHEGLRPTSDKVRESIFNILIHRILEKPFDTFRVIDLFSGTGALGLEAISRGAAFCLFVDHDVSSRALLRNNIEAFSLTGITRIFRRDALDLGPIGTMGKFDLVFMDPPYKKGLGELALSSLEKGDWLNHSAIIVWEEHALANITWPKSFKEVDRRTWGDTQVAFGCFQ
ncbi:MAG: 16S rRNA (guanine(966)-N(2))-methyltransferase RsmD [Hyphomicrobium sp.]